jgi:TfoX/Sxy family transcriptional regulator of competence genes
MEGGSMPKPTEEAKAAFPTLVPDDPAVVIRPMFGNSAAFVNGNMFAGLFGEDLFVRLPEDELKQALQEGGREFAPMPGRPMKGYVVLAGGWREAEPARAWINRSLAWSRELLVKEAKRKK